MKGITDDTQWVELGWINVDAGAVAFCASEDARLEIRIQQAHGTAGDKGTTCQSSFTLQATMEDCSLPVEVQRNEHNSVIAAQICFTSDVDLIAGVWRDIGSLDLTGGVCLACDPFCDGPTYQSEFEVSAGRYAAQIFEYVYPDGAEDVLGLKISKTKTEQ